MSDYSDVIKILFEYQVINQEQLAEAEKILQESLEKEQEITLEQILINLNYITWEHIAACYSQISGIPYVKLVDYELTEELVNKIPEKLARKHNLIAIQQDEDKMIVAISDPNNLAALDDISLMLGFYVEAVIAPLNEILDNINNFYKGDDINISEMMAALGEDGDVTFLESDQNADVAQRKVDDTPVIKYVNLIIKNALKDRASDIHLEPFEKHFRVRERIDGVLLNVQPPPLNLKDSIVSRIKIMADLNIADTRLPQDGSIRMKLGKKSIDLRVACLPTINGEAVVLRVLDKSAVLLSMSDLGLSEHIEKIYRKSLKRPNGIIMITGPTGCGKTTTLYAGMVEINKPESKVITVEDPVEYEIQGMMQCQVNEKVGMTFGSALRAILRQDPDIILIGEMRDPETAGIAIESALTGHLVLSTTHTNEAAGTITRLIDMGAEPFLITSTVQTIIGQRLVRMICPNCKEKYTPEPELFLKLGKRPEDYSNQEFFKGKGCEHCTKTGYFGRVGLFEAFEMKEELMDLIVKKAPANILHNKSLELGMIPMREDGFMKVLEGKTTLEEVIRVAPVEAGVSLLENTL